MAPDVCMDGITSGLLELLPCQIQARGSKHSLVTDNYTFLFKEGLSRKNLLANKFFFTKMLKIL